ncbi:MAG: PAS domain-containing protein [Chloroflexi bacterium]|nr:PAS domain-containing protein [Chloroflexota bacterium]
MRFHRSFTFRVSAVFAAIILATLFPLLFFLFSPPPEPDLDELAELQPLKEKEAEAAATLIANYLASPDSSSNFASFQELGAFLSRWTGSRVIIIAASGEALADSHSDLRSGNGESPVVYDFQSDNLLLRARLGHVATAFAAIFHSYPSQAIYTAAPVLEEGEVIGVVKLETPPPQPAPGVDPDFYWIAAWGLAIGALALSAIWLIARHSSRAQRSQGDLIEGMQRLEGGDYGNRIPPTENTETQPLTEAFNRMADTVGAAIMHLSSERDTLSAVLDTMADGVIVVEPAGQVSLLNPAARELLGIRQEAATGTRLVELVRDNEIHQVIAGCQSEKARQQVEVSLLTPRRYLSAIATPLENNGGVLLTMHDLTRMRQVETSQKEFVSNVSHELRNPMASIQAMVETLESGAVNEPPVALDFLARMRGDVNRINGLVDGLLELSRMESGQFSIEAEPTPLESLIVGVQSRFGDAAAQQEVSLSVSVEPELPLVLADGEKLTQVFVNLVENALKFTPQGGEIRILAQPAGDFVQVDLTDTGVGVAPQHLPHLFERFYKVNRSRRDSGTGLGLAIVKQLVEAHGGQISVQSREGEGCSFTFTIPAASPGVG